MKGNSSQNRYNLANFTTYTISTKCIAIQIYQHDFLFQQQFSIVHPGTSILKFCLNFIAECNHMESEIHQYFNTIDINNLSFANYFLK